MGPACPPREAWKPYLKAGPLAQRADEATRPHLGWGHWPEPRVAPLTIPVRVSRELSSHRRSPLVPRDPGEPSVLSRPPVRPMTRLSQPRSPPTMISLVPPLAMATRRRKRRSTHRSSAGRPHRPPPVMLSASPAIDTLEGEEEGLWRRASGCEGLQARASQAGGGGEARHATHSGCPPRFGREAAERHRGRNVRSWKNLGPGRGPRRIDGRQPHEFKGSGPRTLGRPSPYGRPSVTRATAKIVSSHSPVRRPQNRIVPGPLRRSRRERSLPPTVPPQGPKTSTGVGHRWPSPPASIRPFQIQERPLHRRNGVRDEDVCSRRRATWARGVLSTPPRALGG